MQSDDGSPSQFTLALYTTDASGATVQLEATRSRKYRERFWTMFLTTTETLAAFDRPACYHRALLALMTMADPVQWRRISAKEIATASRMSAHSAERALSMLEADQVILARGETSNKSRRLNNNLVWASRADAHSTAQPDPQIRDARGRG